MNSWSEKYGDWAVPLILVILIGGILAIKVFNLYWVPVLGPLIVGPGGITRVMILTNVEDVNSAKEFAQAIKSRVRGFTTVVDDNLAQHVREGYLTSNDYDLVVIYGDHTRMSPEARKEIASYVSEGGNLMIVKGAGLKDVDDPYIFAWSVEDLAPIISFAPDCGSVEDCREVSQITVTGSEIGDTITFVPVKWKHPIIERVGISEPIDDISVPSGFTLTRVEDLGNNKVAYLEWKDSNGRPHSFPAIIAYQSGLGGRITYLAYNPLDLNQKALFRNILLWAAGKV